MRAPGQPRVNTQSGDYGVTQELRPEWGQSSAPEAWTSTFAYPCPHHSSSMIRAVGSGPPFEGLATTVMRCDLGEEYLFAEGPGWAGVIQNL